MSSSFLIGVKMRKKQMDRVNWKGGKGFEKPKQIHLYLKGASEELKDRDGLSIYRIFVI